MNFVKTFSDILLVYRDLEVFVSKLRQIASKIKTFLTKKNILETLQGYSKKIRNVSSAHHSK